LGDAGKLVGVSLLGGGGIAITQVCIGLGGGIIIIVVVVWIPSYGLNSVF
jgi:hypothetical protein